MQHKVVTAAMVASAAAGLATALAHADRQGVCETLDGLWSDRSEFVQITGRAACELTPETAGSTLLQLQYEYPTDVADDPSGSKQLATWIKSRISFYQGQLAGGADSEIAVGVTYDEQSAGNSRTVVFTEAAFTKGDRQPVTHKLTQTFTVAVSAVAPAPDSAAPTPAPDGSAPAPAAPSAPGATPPAAPAPTGPAVPGTTVPGTTTAPGTTAAPAQPAPSAPPAVGVVPLRTTAPVKPSATNAPPLR